MKRLHVTLPMKQASLIFSILASILLVTFLAPTSRFKEVLLLASLACVALLPLTLQYYQQSTKTFRALRAARREHALFKTAAVDSAKGFAICKPVCDANNKVIGFRFTYSNRAAQSALGKPSRDVLGQSVDTIMISKAQDSLTTLFARVAATGQSESVLVALCGRTDPASTFEISVQALGGAVALAMGRQTLEEVNSERIRELQHFAQSIIETAPISMIATDATGTIIAVNSAAEQLTRYRKNDLIQQHSLTLLHDPAELSSRATELNRILATPIKAGFDALTTKHPGAEAEQREWTYIRKDGSRAWVNLTMTPLQTPDRKVAGHLGIAFDVTERKELIDSVVHMARHDQLTGLPNRLLLNDHLEQGIARAQLSGQKLAVFMVDVDHFKRINDSLGHSAGDAVLKYVARQLSASLRSTDTVARVGGDEFVVLMPDFGNREDAERCADLMLQKVCTPFNLNEREIRMTASIGICLYPDDALTSSDLLKKSDVAMYESKSDGRGCVRSFSEEMQKEAADRLAMEEEIRHAIVNKEFELHYQPQVSCTTGQVTGMEMLLRWKSPKRGNVPPNVFIPIAEEAGLMVQIGEWGVAQACLDCVRAQKELGAPLKVAVNLSPRQFAQKNLPSLVKQSLAISGLSVRDFELEITEQMLMANTPCVMSTLRQIRELGVGIAIDDFGTGFSSFSYILEYHVDRLKIDRSFVSRVSQDENADAIVRAIIAMGRGLNIELVAEGVETSDQLAFLLRKHCDTVQGYLFSKAVPIDAFTEAVREIERAQHSWNHKPQLPAPLTTNGLRWADRQPEVCLPA